MSGKTELEQSLVRVPVDGGELAVGIFGPSDHGAPTVLAAHGITASHRSWLAVAERLPGVRIVAPDLRGRGRSNRLPGPFGMRRYADDLDRVLDHLGIDRALGVGHSMGAFVVTTLAARAPERLPSLVLVDGGLPLDPPEGVDPEAALPASMLGPAAARLTMTFDTREAYREFWAQHPAFPSTLTPELLDYIDYDLDGEPPTHPSASVEAVVADQPEVFGPRWYRDALRSLRVPVTVLRSPLGLLAEPPGLYPPGALEQARELVPQLRIVEVDDVNHYTIVMGEHGAETVAAEIRAALAELA